MNRNIKSAILLSVIVAMSLTAQSAPLTNINAYATKMGGLTSATAPATWNCSPSSTAVIQSVWGLDENVVIPIVLREKAFDLLAAIMSKDSLNASNRVLVAKSVLAQPALPAQIVPIVMAFPLAERVQFEVTLLNASIDLYPGMGDVKKHVTIKNWVIRDISIHDTDITDLVPLLLAPEAASMDDAILYKRLIKEKAIAYARKKLRLEGKTFVVGADGINPLTVKMQPVVDALNAPVCDGLELALRNLGANVPNVGRDSLRAQAGQWQEKIMYGDMSPILHLGKIMIYLGSTEYNIWANKYNKGN